MNLSSPRDARLAVLEDRAIDVSIVVPVYEEEASIAELHHRLTDAVASIDRPAEIIFVDDGSRDGTLSELMRLYHDDPSVRIVSLRRNFGKTPALLAGFAEARGQYVITLDGDLQDDPAELPRFIEALDSGIDLVSGWKKVRHDPISKTVPSRLFNFTVRRATGIPLHDFNCGFKGYRREVLDEVKLYGELHRFIPVMAYRRGFRIGEIDVQHHPRQFGKSKFGAGRFLKGLIDFATVLFLTRYMQQPLQLFGGLGLGLWFLGLLGFIYILILKLLGQSVFATHGPLLFLSGILIVSGIQLIMLGLLGEMLRNYAFRSTEEYSVKQRLAHDD